VIGLIKSNSDLWLINQIDKVDKLCGNKYDDNDYNIPIMVIIIIIIIVIDKLNLNLNLTISLNLLNYINTQKLNDICISIVFVFTKLNLT